MVLYNCSRFSLYFYISEAGSTLPKSSKISVNYYLIELYSISYSIVINQVVRMIIMSLAHNALKQAPLFCIYTLC